MQPTSQGTAPPRERTGRISRLDVRPLEQAKWRHRGRELRRHGLASTGSSDGLRAQHRGGRHTPPAVSARAIGAWTEGSFQRSNFVAPVSGARHLCPLAACTNVVSLLAARMSVIGCKPAAWLTRSESLLMTRRRRRPRAYSIRTLPFPKRGCRASPGRRTWHGAGARQREWIVVGHPASIFSNIT
jgi:hypothetical protein